MVYFAVGAILGYVAYGALVFQPGSELGANARKLARAVPFVVAAALLLAGAVGVLREPGRWVELVLDHAEILLVGMVFGFIAGYAYENVFIPLARGAMNPTVNSMHHSSVAMVWGGILGAILIVGLLAPKLDDIFHIKTPFLELELDTKKSVSQGAALRLGRLENDWKTVTAPLFLYSYPKAIAREALLLDEVKSKRPTRDLAEWADTCVNKGARDNLEFMQNVASLASKFGVDDLLTQIAGKDRAAVGAKIRPVARAMDKLFFTAENQSAIGRPPVITEAEKKEEIDLNDIANAVALAEPGGVSPAENGNGDHAKVAELLAQLRDNGRKDPVRKRTREQILQSQHPYVLVALLHYLGGNDGRALNILLSKDRQDDCEYNFRLNYLLSLEMFYLDAEIPQVIEPLDRMLARANWVDKIVRQMYPQRPEMSNADQKSEETLRAVVRSATSLSKNQYVYTVAIGLSTGASAAADRLPLARKYVKDLTRQLRRKEEQTGPNDVDYEAWDTIATMRTVLLARRDKISSAEVREFRKLIERVEEAEQDLSDSLRRLVKSPIGDVAAFANKRQTRTFLRGTLTNARRLLEKIE